MFWVVLQTVDELFDWMVFEADVVNSGEKRKPGEMEEGFKNDSNNYMNTWHLSDFLLRSRQEDQHHSNVCVLDAS